MESDLLPCYQKTEIIFVFEITIENRQAKMKRRMRLAQDTLEKNHIHSPSTLGITKTPVFNTYINYAV